MSGFEHRRRVEESISTQPWHSAAPVLVGQDTIMKYFFDRVNHTYDVMVYDGTTLRHETIESEREFVSKSKLFNPNLEAGPSSIMEELSKYLGDATKSSQMNFNFDGDILKMTIKTKLKSGIPFSWMFKLKETTQQVVIKHLVQPLTIISAELNRRQQELFHLLERKDREIQDYKDQGAVVSRKHLETASFDRIGFQNTSNLHEVFLTSCTKTPTHTLSKELQDIHRNTVLNSQTCQKINVEDVPAPVIPGPSDTFDTVPIALRGGVNRDDVSSWNDGKRVAGSFAQDKMDGPTAGIMDDPLQQDADTQPVLSVAEPVSPQSRQEEELKRREAIRKRLDEETMKKSKKKRKIKL